MGSSLVSASISWSPAFSFIIIWRMNHDEWWIAWLLCLLSLPNTRKWHWIQFPSTLLITNNIPLQAKLFQFGSLSASVGLSSGLVLSSYLVSSFMTAELEGRMTKWLHALLEFVGSNPDWDNFRFLFFFFVSIILVRSHSGEMVC